MNAAFSNGTEREAWTRLWCAHCTRDHAFHTADSPSAEDGCPLLLASILNPDELPEPWIKVDRPTQPDNMHCQEFTPCACPGDPLTVEQRADLVFRIDTEFRIDWGVFG